jgi:hypothetical protein
MKIFKKTLLQYNNKISERELRRVTRVIHYTEWWIWKKILSRDAAGWGRKLQAWLGACLMKFWEKLSGLLPVILIRQKQVNALRVTKMSSTKFIIASIFVVFTLREACITRT